VASASAPDLLGTPMASTLGWTDLSVARLTGPENELLGLLCLANRGNVLTELERALLQAVAGHAAVALDNSRLFSRIEHSNRQWMEIFDAITDFIVVHDENHRVLRVNRPLAEFIGVHPSELIGVTMRALVSIATEAGPTPCPFCRVGPDADEFLHPVLERTYLVSTSRTQGAFHEGQQVIHVLKDISDRQEAERRYQELFDNIQEGLFFSTPEGRFIEVNDALVRMLGYGSREELLQVNIPTDLFLSPEQRRRFGEGIDKAGALRNFEETLKRKDGSLIHTLQNAVAVRDAQGRVTQYRGVILDITELKTFQSDLQRERDFNSMILNNTQSMILVADPAGYISYANRRCYEIGGYPDGELLGQPLDKFVTPERRSALAGAMTSALHGQQVDNLELPFLRGDGKTCQFSVSLSPMRDEGRKATSIVAVMTDVTDAALLQAKLMHTEKMAAVGQLVSGVAHEVNNPLTAILGFADLLVDQPDIPEYARQDLRLVVQEAQRTKMIVQNLLSFARQMPPQRKSVQVNSVLRRTLQLRSYDFASHGVDVVEELGESLPEIIGDSHQLQQVFLNILNNAYDAVRETGRRGRIEILSGRENGSVVVTFRDNGNGVTSPDRIFDPFFTTKEVGKGTGLGLSICYGIVREHGGEIACENRRDSSGAIFRVKLPLPSSARAEPDWTEAETASHAN
ncbi:MAG: PAS domain S-box protein, partial [Acidobacteria bacterium]|nr:PAS domain S-box protein [Acidobacteriota bacterium]